MTLLVLQHIACEPPAAYEDELHARGLDLVRVQVDEGEPLPDWRDFSVRPGPVPEVGILPVDIAHGAAADPVFADAPARFNALQWHRDTFDLPEGATLLASSPRYPHQAFVWGPDMASNSTSRCHRGLLRSGRKSPSTHGASGSSWVQGRSRVS